MTQSPCDLFAIRLVSRLKGGRISSLTYRIRTMGRIELPINDSSRTQQPFDHRRRNLALLLLIPLLPLFFLGTGISPSSIASFGRSYHSTRTFTTAQLAEAKCPAQPPALDVGSKWNPLIDGEFAQLAAKRLSKAVQIPTESYDNYPVNASDPVWDKHYAFSKFLEQEYPKLFIDPLKHEHVNVHGHLFTWEGSKPDLEPILLMAHIDTVPVLPATLDQWTYPPFEGKISVNGTADTPGTWIWGRGSSDCKNSLLGIYNAVERLVSEGFKPERTILIANGFDEEVSEPTRPY